MNHIKWIRRIVSAFFIVVVLAGCGKNPPSLSTEEMLLTATALRVPTVPPALLTPATPPPMPTVQLEGDYPVVQLTTPLGVEATIQAVHFDAGYYMLNDIVDRGPERGPLLRTSDGIYLLIPWSLFRRAYAGEGMHTVTLANGQELRGILDGSISSLATLDNRTYDLRTASTVVLVTLPTRQPYQRSH